MLAAALDWRDAFGRILACGCRASAGHRRTADRRSAKYVFPLWGKPLRIEAVRIRKEPPIAVKKYGLIRIRLPFGHVPMAKVILVDAGSSRKAEATDMYRADNPWLSLSGILARNLSLVANVRQEPSDRKSV